MATQAGGFVRDQNLNVHFDVAPSTLKTNKSQKNGRKALGDISNSRRPSTNLPPIKQHGSKNVVSAAEDFVPTNLSKSSLGGSKTKVSTKGSGRKVLGDLTNSVNRLVIQESNQACSSKKLSVVVEEEPFLDSEGFGKDYLHDHVECVKAQQKAKAMDLEYFFKGYVQATSPEQAPRSSAEMKFQPETPIKFSELEKVFGQCNRHEMSAEVICASPTSVPRYQWENDTIFHLNSSP